VSNLPLSLHPLLKHKATFFKHGTGVTTKRNLKLISLLLASKENVITFAPAFETQSDVL
jgi:hypothetical protein